MFHLGIRINVPVQTISNVVPVGQEGSTAIATTDTSTRAPRAVRADARRNIEALLEAAKAAFATSGVEAPVREIAARAGVGVGTVYRHFPQRGDLVTAVFRHELDACADAASILAAEHGPVDALELWLERYTDLLATKRGLAAAMHSDARGYESLTDCFQEPLRPALGSLLDSASALGQIRTDVDPVDLLQAVASLCLLDTAQTQRMVALLIDGLQHGAPARLTKS